MSESSSSEDFFELCRESPEIKYEINGTELTLNWGNTLIRHFDEGDGLFDHIAHRASDGSYIGFKVEDEMLETLKELSFPHRCDPVVDETTLQWYLQTIDVDLKKI